MPGTTLETARTSYVIANPRDDMDLERFIEVDVESFGGTAADMRRWLAAGKDRVDIRLARAGDVIVGGYVLAPVGQYFGGRAVPAVAVTAVSVAPAWRRSGVAGALMRDLVVRARERGAALAPLHAATTRLYRRWGWELGDRLLTQRVGTAALSQLRGAGRVASSPDRGAVEAMRRSHLREWDGPLDRPDWWLAVEWDAGDPGEQRFEYGWSEADALTGYVRYGQARPGPGGTGWLSTAVEEFIATTPDALRGLLGFLGGLEAQCPEISFRHGALPARAEPLYLLPDAHRHVEVEGFLCWMQRLVDPAAAIARRGWPTGARATVELEVDDPVTGVERAVLEVSGGEGRLSPGGAGSVRCGIGALAGWYSTTLRARDAVRLGLLEGSPGDVEQLDALIGDRDPWMPDFF